jgi:hypothetical protein
VIFQRLRSPSLPDCLLAMGLLRSYCDCQNVLGKELATFDPPHAGDHPKFIGGIETCSWCRGQED